MRPSTVPFLATALLSAAPIGIAAQLTIGVDDSNFGTRTISPGFLPDPLEVSVISGGSVAVGDLDLGAGCVGYATSKPDYVLHVGDAFPRLTFSFEGDGDTALLINAPDRSWHCNDDASGLDPMVTLDGAAAGHYDIWVSSYSSGATIRGTLSITELATGPASPDADRLRVGSTVGIFGEAELAPGFTPDPYTVSVISGGSVDVSAQRLPAGCVGYAASTPDLVLDWESTGSILHIYFEGEGDTALVVNRPDGTWSCNDDADGLDPMVSFKAPQAGRYGIWVASYSEGSPVSGTLGITELNRDSPQGR